MHALRHHRYVFGIGIAGIGLWLPASASAAPGDKIVVTGNLKVNVVEPVDVQRVADLRFGRIARPATAGTLTIDINGNATATGGVIAAITTPQIVNGRGRAAFALFGDPNRRFHVFLSNSFTLTNGTATMQVSNLTKNAGPPGWSLLDARGYYALFVGGQLTVNANQQPGKYTGTFEVRVQYN